MKVTGQASVEEVFMEGMEKIFLHIILDDPIVEEVGPSPEKS